MIKDMGDLIEKNPFPEASFDKIVNEDKTTSLIIVGLGLIGFIISALNNTWLGGLFGGLFVVLFFIMKYLIQEKPSFKYIATIIIAILNVLIIYQAQQIFLLHLVTFIVLSSLILLKEWKVFIPFMAIVTISIVTFMGLQEIGSFNETVPEEKYHQSAVLYVGLLILSAAICSFLAENLKSITKQKKVLHLQLGQLQEYEKTNIEFARHISSGNFDVKYDLKENDILGLSLIEMSNNLKCAAIDEKQRNWSIQGIARIADILRVNHESIVELAYKVISHIVKYMNANQGGIFIINDEDSNNIFLELKGCYAFERRKFLEKEVKIGEGLVGQAYLEKEMIYMTDIPEDYLNIKSGLGDASPGSIIIVPIKMEEQVIGILELASFEEFKPHERMFLEKVSENIASAIISSKVKDKTDKLLRGAQEMTEEMRAQEEEMRQNMEELQATQESLQRESKEKEKIQQEIVKTRDFLQSVINAIPDPVFVKQREGHRFIMVNKAWVDNYSGGNDVIGKNDYDLFPKELADGFYTDEEKIFLEKSEISREEKGMKNGEEIYNLTKKRVIENEFGEMFLVGINHEITELKKIEKELAKEKNMLDALMSNSNDSTYNEKRIESAFKYITESILITDQEKILRFASQDILVLLKYAKEDIINTNLLALIHKNDMGVLENATNQSMLEKESKVQVRFKTKTGGHIKLDIVIVNALHDKNIKGFLYKMKIS
jgi:methyl-accepting chemotaxis protein